MSINRRRVVLYLEAGDEKRVERVRSGGPLHGARPSLTSTLAVLVRIGLDKVDASERPKEVA